MSGILAIDPGPVESGWVAYDPMFEDGARSPVLAAGIWPNEQLLEGLRWRQSDLHLPPFTWVRPPPVTDGVAQEKIKAFIRDETQPVALVIEQVTAYGMTVGADVFETVYWSGQFAEAIWPNGAARIPRTVIRKHLLPDFKVPRKGEKRPSFDSMIKGALYDRFGGVGGRATAIGTRKAPGPLYGISAHMWSALALAVTYTDLATAEPPNTTAGSA